MKKSLILFAVLAFSVSPAWADQLTLTGENLAWNTANPSPTFTVSVEDTSGPSKNLLVWSLGLEIVPAPGAVGTVQFAGFVNPPSVDYLLNGDSGGITTLAEFPTPSIAPIGDNTNSTTGKVLPAGISQLLQLTFVASPDALGTFNIVVNAHDVIGAYWIWDTVGFTLTAFANAPFGGDSPTIGSLTVVPEPATWLMAGQIALVGAVCLYWRRRRQSATA